MKHPIGIKLKEVREKAGLTQHQLADRAGISASQIGMIESGKSNPSFKSLEKISKVLNVDPKYFLEENKGVFFDEYQDELSIEENNLIREQKFRPWITLAAECDREGLTAEEVKNLLSMVMDVRNKMAHNKKST